MKREKPPTPAEQFIETHRRAFPSLYESDNDVLLCMLSQSRHSYDWDEAGQLQCNYNLKMEESFTAKGWKYMENSRSDKVPTSWTEPKTDSPLLHIPDNIEDSWSSAISGLCYWIAKLKDENVRSWIYLNQEFNNYAEPYKTQHCVSYYSAYERVKAACAHIQQRLKDIKIAKSTKERESTKPNQVCKGVEVYHKGYASTDTAKVIDEGSIVINGDHVAVAILSRKLVNNTRRICPKADLVPLTHPPIQKSSKSAVLSS